MKKNFIKIVSLMLLSNLTVNTERVNALIPFYFIPSSKILERESISIGNNAYQLLYFGQYKESLNLAKLAVKMNKYDDNLWLILSEAQIANKLYKNGLISLNKAEKINPKRSEIFFQKVPFFETRKIRRSKNCNNNRFKFSPDNHEALFQLGNIHLIEKNYSSAIKNFDSAIKIRFNFCKQ